MAGDVFGGGRGSMAGSGTSAVLGGGSGGRNPRAGRSAWGLDPNNYMGSSAPGGFATPTVQGKVYDRPSMGGLSGGFGGGRGGTGAAALGSYQSQGYTASPYMGGGGSGAAAPSSGAPSGSGGGSGAVMGGFAPASSYDTSVASSGYNPYQYATDEAAGRVANYFGGTVGKTDASGPNASPNQNLIMGLGPNPLNAAILGRYAADNGAGAAKSLAQHDETYDAMPELQARQDSANSYYAGLPTTDRSNIVNATLRYSGGTPVGYGGSLYKDPATGRYYVANNSSRGYLYDPNQPLGQEMFTPNSGSSYYTF